MFKNVKKTSLIFFLMIAHTTSSLYCMEFTEDGTTNETLREQEFERAERIARRQKLASQFNIQRFENIHNDESSLPTPQSFTEREHKANLLFKVGLVCISQTIEDLLENTEKLRIDVEKLKTNHGRYTFHSLGTYFNMIQSQCVNAAAKIAAMLLVKNLVSKPLDDCSENLYSYVDQKLSGMHELNQFVQESQNKAHLYALSKKNTELLNNLKQLNHNDSVLINKFQELQETFNKEQSKS